MNNTRSVCPVCLKSIDAKRIQRGDDVYLEKECPQHGRFESLIWRGKGFEEWGNLGEAGEGCPSDCGICDNHKQKTCCVLLEVTSRCSLGCPVCFASAGQGKDMPLEDIIRCYDGMMEQGGPFNIQLSGGEPTERDDIPQIVRLGKSKGFTFIQLNTNGIRIADEVGYAKSLADSGLDCVFLQFDGMDDSVYQTLRGRPLLKKKLAAISACKEAGLGVVLVPVVAKGVNTHQIGDILDFALDNMPTVRGVHFQPISKFGRCDVEAERFTLPELLVEIERQTGKRMRAEHFSPGGAENAYCSFSANYMLHKDDVLRPWGSKKPCGCGSSDNSREFVARQWSGAGCCEESQDCCAETKSLDDFLRRIKTHTLAVSAMAFMDSWTLDIARLRECYIHVVTIRSGEVKLIPFCAYNLSAEDGKTLYR